MTPMSFLSCPITKEVTTQRPSVLRQLLFGLLLVQCALVSASDASAKQKPVKVVSLMYSAYVEDSVVRAINSGFNASLAARGWKVASGANVSTVFCHNYTTDSSKFLQQHLNESYLVVVLGPMTLPNIVAALPLMEKHNLIGIAPFTTSSGLRGWNKHLYFLHADPNAELLALLRYALTQLRVQRLGFMYMTGFDYGEMEYFHAERLLSRIGYEFCCVFVLHSAPKTLAQTSVFEAAWERFAANRPQAVIMFGFPCPEAARFVFRYTKDPRTATAYLLMPSIYNSVIIKPWMQGLKMANRPFVPGQLILASMTPLAKDTEYEAVKRFQVEMEKYLRTNGTAVGFANPRHFLDVDIDGEMMVFGWIAGEVLWQALDGNKWTSNSNSILDSFYNQRRYVIDDIVLGDFGGECKGKANLRGATCKCNQGGNVVYMKRVVENHRMEALPRGSISLGSSNCYSSSHWLFAPLNGLFMLMEDNPLALKTSESIYNGISVLAANGQLGYSDRLFLDTLLSPTSDVASKLKSMLQEKTVTALFGVVTSAMLDIPNITFIDPFSLTPRLSSSLPQLIHLSPTLEQQLSILAEHISETRGAKIRAVIRSEEASAISDALRGSLGMFGQQLISSRALRTGDALGDYLPGGGDVFVLGITPGEVKTIAAYLDKHATVRVFVAFSDFAVLYDEFMSVFKGRKTTDRLIFATNLPHWNDDKPISETARKFRATVGAGERTPLSMMGFTIARLMQEVLSRMQSVNAASLAAFFYTYVVVFVDDMQYGPFVAGSYGSAHSSSGDEQISNYGATQIAVWSLSRVFDPKVTELVAPKKFTMVHRKSGTSTTLLICIVIGAVFVSAVSVAAFMALCLRRNARDNKNAPKIQTAPVTLVFTDIESSTAQWAANPQLMPDAVATHHRLIRALIAQHGCYEVKTIGDSFMIACRSASAAVQLVYDMQHKFLEHNWGTTAFDESYREFEEAKVIEDADATPRTARLEPSVYKQLWNGLRVRAGVHTGLCDIRYDEVTKGYDYYGSTSNTAARTESVAHGGQVLLTRATYMAMTASEREHFDVTSLGAVSLRGVPEPVEMFQLNTVQGRSFGPLRLDEDAATEVIEDPDSGSMCHSIKSSQLLESAQLIAATIKLLLATFGTTQREKLLLSCCERWRVSLPTTESIKSSEDWLNETFQKLSIRVAPLMAHKRGSFDEVSLSRSLSDRLVGAVSFVGRCVSITQSGMQFSGGENLGSLTSLG
ncbi:receptor-type adenylate cyclase GRESAG 4, putative [Trypanosoma vivax Y486]|uniref:adenylate cyclase n=1 Tax=Trypanosoma vivax (strain Y486) TaxID=1055687 RepID=F9WUQ7_TRYVY|nr:receptor-type adenylate cyclase GRESAG 4, putative [Trypanosoma vivax Y486]|eukprot:CCD21306.1 receptor-type adenylate cyclase GRESAG 4, putative [Trypanosoma vivax Y486]